MATRLGVNSELTMLLKPTPISFMKAEVNVQFKTDTEPGETTFKQPCNMIQLNKQRCPVNACLLEKIEKNKLVCKFLSNKTFESGRNIKLTKEMKICKDFFSKEEHISNYYFSQ